MPMGALDVTLGKGAGDGPAAEEAAVEHYEFQAQVTRISPVGLTPEGLRIDLGFAGTVTAGPWAGCAIEGTDYLLMRSDGVGVIDARELISGKEGAAAALHAAGYLVPPIEMPPLTALLDPSFTWPDVDFPLHGSARAQTAATAQAGANHTVYAFTGTANMSTGSLVVAGRSIAAPEAGAAMLARGYEAFAAGDIPAVLSLFAADIDWVEPGSSPLAGRYRGPDEVSGFFAQLARGSGGTFHLEVHDIIADGDQVIALVTEHADAGGTTLAAPAAHVWRVSGGKIAEFRNYYHDQESVDEFWSRHAVSAAG